jgi:hypothetical protein
MVRTKTSSTGQNGPGTALTGGATGGANAVTNVDVSSEDMSVNLLEDTQDEPSTEYLMNIGPPSIARGSSSIARGSSYAPGARILADLKSARTASTNLRKKLDAETRKATQKTEEVKNMKVNVRELKVMLSKKQKAIDDLIAPRRKKIRRGSTTTTGTWTSSGTSWRMPSTPGPRPA